MTKDLLTAIRFLLISTLLTGVLYTALVTGLAQIFYPKQANGSLIYTTDKQVVGSELIAQAFSAAKYFQPRASAVNYNPLPSGGTNLSPASIKLKDQVLARRSQGYTHEMLYASASGLDPHISPAAAYSQVERVATARNLSQERVRDILKQHIEARQLGLLGEPRVNVLKLNLALDQNG